VVTETLMAKDVGLPTCEPEVARGVYCNGCELSMVPTGWPDVTDATDCWVRGDLVAAELAALRARVAELEAANVGLATEAQRLKGGLRFYARGLHFSPDNDADWEDVSGEPPNFLCDERGTTIEDGTIAKDVLLGRDAAWTGDYWPPDELPEETSASAGAVPK
jgi:hypothetical protein